MCRYDCMLLCVIGSAASGALYLLTSSAIWLGVPQILSWYGDSSYIVSSQSSPGRRTYTTITLTMLLVSGSMWTAIAMLWIHGLDLRYPAPFIGHH